MRKEINFRAKSLKDGTWHYGFVIPFEDEIALLYERSIDDPTICGLTSIDVDQNTVGQFTGMYDKNGTPIYEDDIIRFVNGTKKNPDTGQWEENARYILVQFVDGGFTNQSLFYASSAVEVKGNRFDNPQMVKGAM